MDREQVAELTGLPMELVLQLAEKKGKAEAQREIAINLLKGGMEYELVGQITGLSRELVVKLAENIGDRHC
ncbi:MAG: hypothetical protein HC852_12175 [Acaryochloridaceae cyanobacterium RU_4_10]|nr:hypothetical protein [Acaryochloridaceae cyanobacterium RU_4_10]